MSSPSSVGSNPQQYPISPDITNEIQGSIRMGNRSYFVEKWTESCDILTTAVKTRNTGQCFFALVRMFVQAAATLTLILPLISVYKGWSQATHKIDMTYKIMSGISLILMVAR